MVFPVLNEEIKDKMINLIKEKKEQGDSIGGILEIATNKLPIGLGEPYFNGVDAYISSLLLSLGGVKGIIFGNEEKVLSLGSKYNDNLRYNEGNIEYLSNNSGGVLGGLTTGEPLNIKLLVKPTPSIAIEQKSVNVLTKENIDLTINGRHDPCIVHRIRSAAESLVAFALVDLIMLNNASKW